MLEKLDKKLKADIVKYFSTSTNELCGAVINYNGKQIFRELRNISDMPHLDFIIDPRGYSELLDKYEILAIVHSHPSSSCKESQSDLVGCEKSNLPWIIVSGDNFNIIKPSGYKAKLTGREFSHGNLDCYTLIKDYYEIELDIKIPDFPREQFWWRKGQNLYLEGYSKAGFHKVEDLNKHDVILIQVGSRIPNHGAIYLGDTKILHHPTDRLSHIAIYGGYWRKNTWCYLRHEQLSNN